MTDIKKWYKVNDLDRDTLALLLLLLFHQKWKKRFTLSHILQFKMDYLHLNHNLKAKCQSGKVS